MNRPADQPRMPGRTFLKIAPLLFNQQFIAAVVQPTIADFQSEFAAAGTSRMKRFFVRWRGYRAVWMVTLAAPFASWAAAPESQTALASTPVAGLLVVASITLAFLALTRAMLGGSGAIVTAAGSLMAILIHAWYERHPTATPAPSDQAWRPPQINFSSTEVAGNIGGLIFVIGSLLIVSIGLPSVLWFLSAGSVAGCLLAWRLAAWHSRHPKWGLPENRIVLR